jgi:hypothetical protein
MSSGEFPVAAVGKGPLQPLVTMLVVEPPRGDPGERRVCDVGERLTAPQGKGSAQQSRRLFGIIPLGGGRAVLQELLEPEGVHVAGFDVQHVSRGPGQQDPGRKPVAENTAKACDVGLDGVAGGRWRTGPHRSSISCAVETMLPAFRIRSASSAPCFGPPSGRLCRPLATSTGPRTWHQRSPRPTMAAR